MIKQYKKVAWIYIVGFWATVLAMFASMLHSDLTFPLLQIICIFMIYALCIVYYCSWKKIPLYDCIYILLAVACFVYSWIINNNYYAPLLGVLASFILASTVKSCSMMIKSSSIKKALISICFVKRDRLNDGPFSILIARFVSPAPTEILLYKEESSESDALRHIRYFS